MLCPICSNELKDTAKFCGKCGNKIPRCPTCARPLTKRSRFCIHDGTPIPDEINALFPEPAPAVIPVPIVPEPEDTVSMIEAELKKIIGTTDAPDAAPEEVPEPVDVIEEEIAPQEEEFEEIIVPPIPVPTPAPAPAPAQPRRFCIKCGTPVTGAQKLCDNCSAAQAAPAPAPAPAQPRRFCVSCGSPVIGDRKYCEACAAEGSAPAAAPEPARKKPRKRLGLILLLLLLCVGIIGATCVLAWDILPWGSGDAAETTEATTNGGEDIPADTDGEAAVADPTGEAVAPDATTAPVPETTAPAVETTAPVPETTAPVVTEPPVVTYRSTYEVIAGDLSWQEAKQACEARGGTLASINSAEEYNTICTLATESGLTYLWLGACLYSDSDEWASSTWLTGEPWGFEVWYPNEPSKTDEDGTSEYYLCLWNAKYDGKELGWTFNDQRNDIVGAFPKTSGKVGYICEYITETTP